MSVLVALSEEECALVSILQDVSGVDIAEFAFRDRESSDGVFRCWPHQYHWYRETHKQQIDQSGRSVGKSVSIQLRAAAFPFNYPGAEMMITAPQLVHLDPVVKYVESRLVETKLVREMLAPVKGAQSPIRKRPFEMRFNNGAIILGRIPNVDGRGVKGIHPKVLEMDEAQDFPQAGWTEIIETLRYGDTDARWRVHGVSRGVHDYFYKLSTSSEWKVHKLSGMHRPDWDDKERKAKIELYGSRDDPDYRRNILGSHGDGASTLFVLSRLMACVDADKDSEYNTTEYVFQRITEEMYRDAGIPIQDMLRLDMRHTAEYRGFWMGADMGMTQAPTEILIFAESPFDLDGNPVPLPVLKLVMRVSLMRIAAKDQVAILHRLAEFYRPKAFGMDSTGVGLPIYQYCMDDSLLSGLTHGYNFNVKVIVGYHKRREAEGYDWDQRDEYYDGPYELDKLSLGENTEISANVLEYSSDKMREFVDQRRLILPFDTELLKEFQGERYLVTKNPYNAYGRREYSKGKIHTLDAARMMIAAYGQLQLKAMIPEEDNEIVSVGWA